MKNSQTYKIEIKNIKDVYDFCLLNEIMDINEFVMKCFKKGFDIEKYGLLDNSNEVREVVKEVPVEVIKYVDREVIKEIPTEVIKYVDKEVPTEVIKYVDKVVIKEVPIEKIVTISDDTQINELLLRIDMLEKEKQKFSIIKSELESEIQKFSTKTNDTTNIFDNKLNEKLKMLENTLLSLRKDLTLKDSKIIELEKTIKEINENKINHGAAYLKGSNLTQNL